MPDTIETAWPSPMQVSENGTVVLVVDGDGPLTAEAARLCAWLGLPVVRVRAGKGVAAALIRQRPMAVIADVGEGAMDGAALMQAISLHDPHLPTLVGAMPDDEEAVASVRAAAARVQLSAVSSCDSLPAPEQVMSFLFRAGRRCGRTGLMPI